MDPPLGVVELGVVPLSRAALQVVGRLGVDLGLFCALEGNPDVPFLFVGIQDEALIGLPELVPDYLSHNPFPAVELDGIAGLYLPPFQPVELHGYNPLPQYRQVTAALIPLES